MWCDSWGLLDYYEESAVKSQGSEKKIPWPRMDPRMGPWQATAIATEKMLPT